MVLEQRGHRPLPAPDTVTARSVIEAESPGVALVDAGMPTGGVRFWQELEEDGSVPGGALLLTGDPYALGALADHPRVLGKPFDYGLLVARLERMADALDTAPEPARGPGEP